MNKLLFIGIGGIVLIILFIIAYRFTSPPSTPQTQTATTTSVNVGNIPTSTTVPGAFVTPQTPPSTGGSVSTDILKNPETIPDSSNPGYYFLGYHTTQGNSDATATTAPPYIIEYISATQYFNITLLQEPIGATRQQAEQYLLQHLGLSEDQLCKLDYMVSVPGIVNEQFSGENLGFSFCPGAVTLPQ